MNVTRLAVACVSLSAMVGLWAAAQQAQDTSKPTQDNPKKGSKKNTPDKKATVESRETNAKPMSEKERKKKAEQLRKELETPYRKWLNEDVAWIITDEERSAFKRLQTDE
jgi:hypothetical protein